MNLTDLSIIIPNFNHSQFINDFFQNLLTLTIMPREFVIIDDCSTDKSVNLIKENIVKLSNQFSNVKIIFIKNKKNRGVIFCDNLGAKKATSKYIYFASIDDLINPDFIFKSMNCLNTFPEAVFSSCIVKVQSPNGQYVNFPLRLPLKKTGFIPSKKCREILLTQDYWTGGNSCIYKRDKYLELGGLNKKFKSCSDIYLSMLIVAKYGALFIPEQLTTFNLSENSFSAKLYSVNEIFKLKSIYKKMYNNFLLDYPDLFDRDFVNSMRTRQEVRLLIIEIKKIIDEKCKIFSQSTYSINFFLTFCTKLLSYSGILLILIYFFLTKKENVRNMLIDMFMIKYNQKKSLLKL
jgi:glycosyltransferase involved in cell wall biosynthesis